MNCVHLLPFILKQLIMLSMVFLDQFLFSFFYYYYVKVLSLFKLNRFLLTTAN